MGKNLDAVDEINLSHMPNTSFDKAPPVVVDNSNFRQHEVYEDTYYIPNNKLRLLEIPMNSSLNF